MNAPLHPLPGPADAGQWLRRDAIAELADLAASLSASLYEAARRDADDLVDLHAGQLVTTVRTLAKTVDELRGRR
jgi:hypothetical protein